MEQGSAPQVDQSERYNVLVVEDDTHMLRFVAQRLEQDGHAVTGLGEGLQAIEVARGSAFDLIVLDVGLPGIDGFEVARRIREFSEVPIIMLTGYTETTTKLRGFASGADDYIVKPFNSDELIARIRAVMRRVSRPASTPAALDGLIVAGDLEINDAQRRVAYRGAEVRLTRMEYKLLRQLALSADAVMEHADLLSSAWGPEYSDDLGYLRVYIRRLREKIEPDTVTPTVIRTVQGVGYMLSTETPQPRCG